jgi:hypothetical protein
MMPKTHTSIIKEASEFQTPKIESLLHRIRPYALLNDDKIPGGVENVGTVFIKLVTGRPDYHCYREEGPGRSERLKDCCKGGNGLGYSTTETNAVTAGLGVIVTPSMIVVVTPARVRMILEIEG